MKRLRSAGFTLLEIMVVLFLVSLIAMIVVPKLSFHRSSGIRKATRDLVREIKILHWEAISRQEMIRLEYDLDRRWVRAQILDPSGTIKSFRSSEIKDFKLPEKVRFSRIDVLHEGKVSDGKTFTQFFPGGPVEPTRIYLSDGGGRQMTIAVRPLTGRVKVMKGRIPEGKTPPAFYGPSSGTVPSMEEADD